MMRVEKPFENVIHLRFPNQGSICSAMVRLQEYYESPYPEIRGHRFTFEEYAARYSRDHDDVYTYNTDWNGFNVPGHVVLEFMNLFADDLNFMERAIRAAVSGHAKFYLIGTHDNAEDALDHEIAHALWYLLPTYQAVARNRLHEFQVCAPRTWQVLQDWLIKQGYDESVLPDETNAYMSTTEVDYWTEHEIDQETAYTLEQESLRFKQLFKTCKAVLTPLHS